jgi:putative transposase
MDKEHVLPHASNLRKARISLEGHAYFVTKCVRKDMGSPLRESGYAEIVATSLLWAKTQGWWRILGFVVMPDHFHAVVRLWSDKALSAIMESIAKFTSRQINLDLVREGRLWEDGFYEHAIRDGQDFDEILEYMHNNPLRAGLVTSADEWQHSTASSTYAAEIDWEWLGPSLPSASGSKYRYIK